MIRQARRYLTGAAALVLVAALATAPPAVAVSPNIVISQVYGDGGNSSAVYTHDFVELFNRGSSTVDFDSWAIQYKSASGTVWTVNALTGTIPAGGYYLIRGATGGAAGAELPPPDALTSINSARAQGTFALTSATTALTCTTAAECAGVPAIVDLVGYGVADGVISGANTYEGSGAAPTGSTTQWAYRLDDGCQDTDNNTADFDSGSLSPRNSAATITPCSLPSLSAGNVSVTETENNVTAAVPVTLSQASETTVTAAFATAAGTAKSADFVAKSGTVTFAAGQTQRTINITVKGDLLDEPNEAFTVTLSAPSAATISDATGRVSIIDDDPPPGLFISDLSVTEGDSGSVAATFVVRLTAASGRTVRSNWTTVDDTATSPSDYAAGSGQLSFSPGAMRRTVTVAVKGDTKNETNEVYRVRLYSPVNATYVDKVGKGTIVDDD